MIPHGGTCGVCGRPLDDSVAVLQLRLPSGLVRVCTRSCIGSADTLKWIRENRTMHDRTRIAGRLKSRYDEIDEACRNGDVSVRDALPLLRKLVSEQCRLLWVVDPAQD